MTYKLDQNDFLQHQLFLASKSERIKRQRTTTWLILSATLLFLSHLFYKSGDNVLFYYFLISGILIFIFYPFYQRRHYKNHYNKFIADTYKNRFGQTANIKFTDSVIETTDITGESKINLTELENVTETGSYFFPKLKTGGHIIIPKAKIDNVNELKNVLKQLCENLNIDFVEDLSWKWK
ncbi:MAG TPA: hypothetical protein VFW07_21260 [Parafilimonas sp.]|nr:hypothetical protein [Parafilimonas sp.]